MIKVKELYPGEDYVPGYRNGFILFICILIPSFFLIMILGIIFNGGNDTYSFSLTFLSFLIIGIAYGLILLYFDHRKSDFKICKLRTIAGIYAVIIFLFVPLTAVWIADFNYSFGIEMGFGMIIGFFIGVALVLFYLWRKKRDDWNASHPEKTC